MKMGLGQHEMKGKVGFIGLIVQKEFCWNVCVFSSILKH